MKAIIFLGAPGSNKTRAAEILKSAFGFGHISWGEILKKETASTDYKKSGTELLKTIISLSKENPVNPVIIEGYPMHIREAKALLNCFKKNNIDIEAIIRFNSSLKKSLKRRQHKQFCTICHREFTKELLSCPFDGSLLIDAHELGPKMLENEYHYFTDCIKDMDEYLNEYSPINFAIDADADTNEIVAAIVTGLYSKKSKDNVFHRASSTILNTEYGEFELIAYQSSVDYSSHLALVKGEVTNKNDILLRVHSSCVTGDIFHSKHCDCGQQLERAFEIIQKEGTGIIMYLFQEGRGINIINKIKAYKLQSEGMDTVDANRALGMPSEMRSYEIVKDIIKDLGVKSIILLTNNPDKIGKIKTLGVTVKDVRSHEINANSTNYKYLKTKKERMNHQLNLT